MAKTVSDVILRLKTEGVQGLDRLKSSFRGLEKAIGPTDAQLLKIQRELKEVAVGTNTSVQAIEGQIDAFKALKKQATIGGDAYKKLTKDIKDLTESLRILGDEYQDAEKKARSLAQQEGVFAAKTGDKINNQFAARRKILAGLSIGSKEYGTLLARQTLQEDAYNRALARRRVIAAAATETRLGIPGQGAMDMSKEAIRAYYTRGIGELPNTTAALQLQLRDLQADLVNVTRGGETYNIISKEMSRIQRELNKDLDANANSYARIARKLRLIQTQTQAAGSGFLEFSQRATAGAAATEGAIQKSIDRQRRKRFVYSYERPSTGDLGPTPSVTAAMRMGQAGAARPPIGARGYAQGAGAALSGGIFGGPEGFLGGLGGLALGGPSGAFAGAAAGAQVSMLRKSIGSTSEYAAQIGKLQIALRGVAGSQAQFNQAMRAASDATKNLNVPQETAIGGMTRLTAAIRGAGGSVTDAELVFKNVTSAIKATGGGAQDVQSAITAMVQVFSKGKVSAEELSGQLGERLPGAVTMFAKANKMTLPQLQKALKDGTVGLNELMNFIVELGVKYDKTAKDIAGSSKEAGARLTASFNQMRLEVGKALQPIGAEFQDAFAAFISQTTPQLIEASKATSAAITVILNNMGNIVNVTKFAIALAGVTLALKAMVALRAPVNAFFLLLQAHFGKTTAQAIVAQTQLKAFALTVKTLAASLAAPIIITVALVGGQIVLNWLERIKKAKQDLLDQEKKPVGESFLKSIGGDAATKETIKRNLADINKAYDTYTETIAKRGERLNKMITEQRLLQQGGPITALAARGMQTKIDVLQAEQDADIRKYVDLQRSREALQRRLPFAPEGGITQFDPVAGDGSGGGKGKVLMSAEELRLRKALLNAGFEENKVAQINAQYNLDRFLALQETEDINKRLLGLAQADAAYTQSMIDAENERVEKLKERQKLELDLNKQLQDRKYELGLITKEQYNQYLIEQEKKRLQEAYPGEGFAGKRAELADLYRRQVDPTFKEAGETEVKKMQEDLDAMLKPINQLKEGAMAFGQAFSTAFTNVITGAQSAQEAMGTFLKNLGQYFIDYAAKLITQMIAIATIQAVIKALGGPSLSGGGGGGQGLQWNEQLMDFTPVKSANGNVFNKGLKRYAMGGIVNKPTMFKYADGGTGSFGLMGEAGPEAIIPLRRGPDGRLGVSAFADSRAALNSGTTQSRAAAMDEARTSLDGMSAIERERRMERVIASGASSTEIKYSRVGSGDLPFVTEENMLQATRIAAQEGARLGQARTLAALKNNPGTRRTVGI